MQTVFQGEVVVDYGQAYLVSDSSWPEDPMGGAFPGQVNGLCGAALPGFLFLVTGLHDGPVGFTVELHDKQPSIEEIWEDVVEVSFRPGSGTVALVEWGGETAVSMVLEPRDLRVRYSAHGMDLVRNPAASGGSLNSTGTSSSSGRRRPAPTGW